MRVCGPQAFRGRIQAASRRRNSPFAFGPERLSIFFPREQLRRSSRPAACAEFRSMRHEAASRPGAHPRFRRDLSWRTRMPAAEACRRERLRGESCRRRGLGERFSRSTVAGHTRGPACRIRTATSDPGARRNAFLPPGCAAQAPSGEPFTVSRGTFGPSACTASTRQRTKTTDECVPSSRQQECRPHTSALLRTAFYWRPGEAELLAKREGAQRETRLPSTSLRAAPGR